MPHPGTWCIRTASSSLIGTSTLPRYSRTTASTRCSSTSSDRAAEARATRGFHHCGATGRCCWSIRGRRRNVRGLSLYVRSRVG
eukprot:6965995-Prymnesium_polylepis.1